MNTVEVLKNTPSVRFLSLGEKYRSGNNELKFIVDNPTGETQTVKYSIKIAKQKKNKEKRHPTECPSDAVKAQISDNYNHLHHVCANASAHR